MNKVFSRNEELTKVYIRKLGYRGNILIGFRPPVSDFISNNDTDKLTCPFSKIIRKYHKALGKCVWIPVPCGKCMYCKHRNQNSLIFRLYNHAKCYKNCAFVTLTYNDAHYSDNVEDLRSDITKFLKRFRKAFNDKTFSYYMVCERGDIRNRCHFHLLMFWNGPASFHDVCSLVSDKWVASPRSLDLSLNAVSDQYRENGVNIFTPYSIGFKFFENVIDENGSISTAIMSYVSKYVSDNIKKLVFRSWSLGLGRDILSCDDDLLQKLLQLKIISYSPNENVYNIAVPQYYKHAIFSQGQIDVMFNDYLLSDEYQNYMHICRSDTKRKAIFEAYEAYEKRCLERWNARCQMKRKRKRLL